MNEKFHVPFDTADLLRKKGYNNKVDYYYLPNGEICLAVITEVSNDTLDYENNGTIAAPTYHEVVDWLDGKGIRIEVRMAYQFREKQWSWCGYVYVVEDEDYETSQLADWCSTREESINVSILKALEML